MSEHESFRPLATYSDADLVEHRSTYQKWATRLAVGAVVFGLAAGAIKVGTVIAEGEPTYDPQSDCVPVEGSDQYNPRNYQQRAASNDADILYFGLQGQTCHSGEQLPVSPTSSTVTPQS